MVKLLLIRLVDKTLGLVWGLIKAVIFLFVVIFIIEIMPGEAFAAAKTALNDSLFASFLQNYNVFTIAMNWIATKLNLSI
ncbi:MAG: CvpA family protein [Clostridia bacterium]|nr:CvpA family protein [Clostridia bacterium]